MNLKVLKAVIRPFLPTFEGYLSQMSAPVDEGGYLQPGDNMVSLTIYQDASGIQIAAMSYRFDTAQNPPMIIVTSINSLGNFKSLR